MPSPRLIVLAACVLALVPGSRLSAQASSPSGINSIPFSDEYILQSWDRQGGLPYLDLKSITQTSDGYLWIATQNGLIRFDGAQFTTIPESSGLDPISTSVLLTAKDGTLWVGFGQGGLAHWSEGRFQVVVPSTTDPNRWLLSLAEDAEGGIWGALVNGGVIRWQHGKLTWFDLPGGNLPFLYCATDGSMWFSTSGDFGFFDNGAFRSFPTKDRQYAHLAVARQGGMWALLGQQLARVERDGKLEPVADLSWLGGATQVTVLYEDRENGLWIGTRGVGLLYFRNGKFVRVPTSFPMIQCLYEDRDGNIWAGTHGGGLNRLSIRHFFLRSAPVDPAANPASPRASDVTSFAVDRDGTLWMAQGYALVRETAPGTRTFALAPGWAMPGMVLSLAIDARGRCWLGDTQHTLECWQNGASLLSLSLPGRFASFTLDPQDGIWISVKDPHAGLYRWLPGMSEPRAEAPEIADPVCISFDSQKRLWVGTNDGRVFYREGPRFIEVPLSPPQQGNMISFITPDGADTVWIGCLGSGLYRWHAGKILQLPQNPEFPARELETLQIAPDGNFWFGTVEGLIRATREQIEGVLEGRESTLQTVTYGETDGIPGIIGFKVGLLHSTAQTPDGHLWFASTLGALEIVPKAIRNENRPSEVLIEDFLAGGNSCRLPSAGGFLLLPPQPGTIQIRYTVPELSAPEQVRFRHRLLGANDDSWSPPDNQRSAMFPNLPPGHYTFEVAATDPARLRQPETASISFTVKAAWWQTLWFRSGCLLVGTLTLAGAIRTVLKRRLQATLLRLEQENALERERARIARNMHDELGASLTHIILMSEAAASDSSSRDLDQIADAARSVSSTLDEIVWATNPRNDTLARLVAYITEFAGEYLETAGINFRVELSTEIPDSPISAERRHEILLVVKETLNNIVKHAEAHRVLLHIELQDHELRITIRDDGRGFSAGDVALTSNGLVNMEHRMASAGGTAKIDSRPGNGTTVTLSMKV
jgi:signal transduction histidine kinase/ligand-binding sensor domain-containing protein